MVKLFALAVLLTGVMLGWFGYNHCHTENASFAAYEIGQFVGFADALSATPLHVYDQHLLHLPGWMAGLVGRLLHLQLWLAALCFLPIAIAVFSIGFDIAIRTNDPEDQDEVYF